MPTRQNRRSISKMASLYVLLLLCYSNSNDIFWMSWRRCLFIRYLFFFFINLHLSCTQVEELGIRLESWIFLMSERKLFLPNRNRGKYVSGNFHRLLPCFCYNSLIYINNSILRINIFSSKIFFSLTNKKIKNAFLFEK